MRKVTALHGFEWYPDGKREDGTMFPRQVVLEGQSIEVTDEQAQLLADHGHIERPAGMSAPSPSIALPAPTSDHDEV